MQGGRPSRPTPESRVEWVEGRVGFEPTTRGLKVPCSAAELPAHRYVASSRSVGADYWRFGLRPRPTESFERRCSLPPPPPGQRLSVKWLSHRTIGRAWCRSAVIGRGCVPHH